ncbi:MAG: hypothetical protein PF518_16975 [Spirochaetaceae bacterium]|jgi:hypothetical protein|nr:hypothetical protein [Spirochaetaceae bacterium]
MADYRSGREKKKIGCFGIFLIILIVLVILIGAGYLFLPRIVSNALNGGFVSTLLPQELREGTEEFNVKISENIGELDKLGISPEEASVLISSIDFGTVEKLIYRIEKTPVTNSNELIDMASDYIDLSSVDLEKIKEEYYTEFSEESVQRFISQFNENPRFIKTGFNVGKTSILQILENKN